MIAQINYKKSYDQIVKDERDPDREEMREINLGYEKQLLNQPLINPRYAERIANYSHLIGVELEDQSLDRRSHNPGSK